MKGETHQQICLVSAANGMLRSELDPATFFPGHPAFAYCNTVRFVDFRQHPEGTYQEWERFADPLHWLRDLQHRNATAVWLEFTSSDAADLPDRMLAGFAGGGGGWRMVATGPGFTESWLNRWKVVEEERAGDRPWAVTYGRSTVLEAATAPPLVDGGEASNRLRAALEAIGAFAEAHAPGWAQLFADASAILESGPTGMSAVEIPCFQNHPEEARRLYGAAYKAWVFGGMGSWNDLGFQSPASHATYEAVSEELYAGIIHAVQTASCMYRGTKSAGRS